MKRKKTAEEVRSGLFRRSGVGLVSTAEVIDWTPEMIIQVGVGINHQEIDVMKECWYIEKENIIGFEAHPKIFDDIAETYPGTLFNIAVSSKPGRVKLYGKVNHSDGSSLYPFIKDEKLREFDVEANSLDELLGNIDLSKRILLWIDCEGHELEVLEGARDFLEFVDVINIEMTMNPPGVGWCSAEDIHWWLMDHEFYRMWIHTHRPHSGQYDGVYVKRSLFKPTHSCCPHTILEWRTRCQRDK